MLSMGRVTRIVCDFFRESAGSCRLPAPPAGEQWEYRRAQDSRNVIVSFAPLQNIRERSIRLPERAFQICCGLGIMSFGPLEPCSPRDFSASRRAVFECLFIHLEAFGMRETPRKGREREPNPPVLSRLRQWAFFVFLTLWFSKTANFWISKLTW